ncbi:Coenzyme F420 hydrogenase/dehydrogenase, beta subunit C-terminal domain [Porphyromonas asaccharolytica]
MHHTRDVDAMIQIEEKQRCCGCEACRQICPKGCIRLERDEEGFDYPIVDTDRCIECHKCERVCPFMKLDEPHKPQAVYAACATDEELRRESSSGGLFTLLAEDTLRRGGVVFGARFDDTWSVCHDYTETIEGLAPFRGSKYLQSRIGDSYQQAEQFLKEGRSVLFTGTPCQVKGLVNYLGRAYDNLTAVDVVCHGVPSPMVWQRYLATLRAEQGEIEGISFRDKSLSGWRRYNFVAQMATHSGGGGVRQFYGDNIYMRGFLHDLYLRPSCYACMAKGGRSHSDLTLGDYWGVERTCPDLDRALDEDKGTSVVMIHSERGRSLLEGLPCRYQETNYASALAGNPAIERMVAEPPKRQLFFEQLDAEPLAQLIDRLTTIPLHQRLWRLLHHGAHRIKMRLHRLV